MNSLQTRPLPNAADKAALKAIAVTVVQTCPSLQDTAHEVASDLLKQHELHGLDPDHVYFHRFKAAQSSTKSFTGWEHIREKPYESMTLTQLVIHRFRATDQDNADLLDLYAGFYTAGPEAENFNETNDVHLHGSDVLKAFWPIDFSTLYTDRLTAFWNKSSDDFRTLAKCNFLSAAVQALERKQLTEADFKRITDAVIGPVSWPASLEMLQSMHPVGSEVRTVELDGHVATNLLRIVDPEGRQVLYLPGEAKSFLILETEADLHWWMLQELNEAASRKVFLNHFPLADRHAIEQNLTDLMNRLVSSWGRSDHSLINQQNHTLIGDAFSWLRDSTRNAMFAEASLSLTSNGDLRKKLWIGYLSAGLKVFTPMGVVGWPVALIIIGAGLASMGLNIDQAVNGKTAEERKQGVSGAIRNGIETLFNLPMLIGTGPMLEVGAEVDAAEAAEMGEYSEYLTPSEPPATSVDQPEVSIPDESDIRVPDIEQGPLIPVDAKPPQVPDKYLCNELLDGMTPETEPGKFQGIYRLDGDPPYAILMDDNPYYVRYFPESESKGYWAIVDPERPNQFVNSLPVRLNAAGQWERMRPLRLRGGGQCFGKECVPQDIELNEREPAQGSSASQPDSTPPVVAQAPIRLVTTSYDASIALQTTLKTWAMNLPEEDFAEWQPPEARGNPAEQEPFARFFEGKRAALLNSSSTFFRNLPWRNLPPRPGLPDIDPGMTFADLIDRIFEAFPGLVMGETLDRISSMRLMIENMPALARHAKIIYVRRLLNDFAQGALNDYFRTGTMSDDLQTYLAGLNTDPAERFNMLELVKTARENDVRIQALDCVASYKSTILRTSIEEQMIANHLTHEIMFLDKTLNKTGNWIVLTEAPNTNTFRGLAGVSEIEGGMGLRIEEVNLGEETGVDIDPGTEVDRGPVPEHPEDLIRITHDTLNADLRLRVEAPPVRWSEQQLEKLLYRPATYIFEKTAEGYTLVHRSRRGMLIRTPVQQLADEHFSIHRPEWPSINDAAFSNMEQLSSGLNRMGMTLQSRIPA
jgi:hypothetical protein